MGLATLAFAYAAPGAAPATAGTVILEGSDAIGLHCGEGIATACDYENQTWKAIGGSSPLPIAVVGTGFGTITSSTHPVVDFATLDSPGVGALSSYVAIYFVAGGGCCNSDPGDMGTRAADVAAYVKAGGTVEIGNYDGNSGWDFLVGGSGNSAFVGGVGGALSGPGCTDGETVTALGIKNGFTQPGTIGCWTHQAYSQPHFGALGFTESFFDSDPAFAADNPGFGPFSSLLSNGSTITGGGGGVPEASTWAMMVVGFAGLSFLGYRTSRKRAVFAV